MRNAIRMMLALVLISALAVTFARAQKLGGGNSLSGTSWQLVKVQGPDEQTFAPDDKVKVHDRLFLSGMTGGGYYELEPLPKGD